MKSPGNTLNGAGFLYMSFFFFFPDCILFPMKFRIFFLGRSNRIEGVFVRIYITCIVFRFRYPLVRETRVPVIDYEQSLKLGRRAEGHQCLLSKVCTIRVNTERGSLTRVFVPEWFSAFRSKTLI